jgi:hypothetical protein
MAESQAPLSQLNQFLPYLKDHLLLDKNVDALIIEPFIGRNPPQAVENRNRRFGV